MRSNQAAAFRERIQSYDTPAQIAMCESCRKADCDDCIGRHMSSGRNAEKWVQFRALYDQGLTDGEIAEKTDLSRATVCYRRKRCGLKPNPCRVTRDPCAGCSSAEVCRAHSGTCGEKARWSAKAALAGGERTIHGERSQGPEEGGDNGGNKPNGGGE